MIRAAVGLSPVLMFLLSSGLTARAETPDTVAVAIIEELARARAAPRDPSAAPLYWLGLRVTEDLRRSLIVTDGVVMEPPARVSRFAKVEARVGSPAIDNTHTLREHYDWSFPSPVSVPIEDELWPLRVAFWDALEKGVRGALEEYQKVVANRSVRVAETDGSPDFSSDPPHVALFPRRPLPDLSARYREAMLEASARLDDPAIYTGVVGLSGDAVTRWVYDMAGGQVRQTWHAHRAWVTATAIASDGMRVSLYRWIDASVPERLPEPNELVAWASALRDDVLALRAAPLAEPYSGPVLLRGRAAAVFMHEVIGHRAEGHRQKDEAEGATFRDAVGRIVTTTALTLVDDPGLSRYGDHDLAGHYAYDDEGQPARRTVIIEDGVFRGFMMGRSPIAGFPMSNGHGRADAYERPVARMANTIVETRTPTPLRELRERLISEARAQGLPHALMVDEIDGGFTLTGRTFPNSFNVTATTAWHVYVDGRPDELVRGVDLIGTPIQALRAITHVGDDPEIFSGWCGAESGAVPVASVSPSLLIQRLELQRKDKEQARPPLLSRPEDADGGQQ